MSNKSKKVNLIKNDTTPMKECCSICLGSVEIPLILASCSHKFCFLCAKELKITHPRQPITCPLCRRNINDDFDHVQFEDSKSVLSSFNGKPCWMYKSRDMQGWWIYDRRTNKFLEKEYQKDNAGKIAALVGSRNYNIDFQKMEQEYQLKYRKLKRIDSLEEKHIADYDVRGIAGVFFKIK